MEQPVDSNDLKASYGSEYMFITTEIYKTILGYYRAMLGDGQIPKFRPFVSFNGDAMPES